MFYSFNSLVVTNRQNKLQRLSLYFASKTIILAYRPTVNDKENKLNKIDSNSQCYKILILCYRRRDKIS